MGSRFAAVILVICLVTGCDREPAAWQAAEVDGSREALESFLEQFPGGRHAADAKGRLTQMAADADWATMGESPGLAALVSFIDRSRILRRFRGLSRLEGAPTNRHAVSMSTEAPSDKAYYRVGHFSLQINDRH